MDEMNKIPENESKPTTDTTTGNKSKEKMLIGVIVGLVVVIVALIVIMAIMLGSQNKPHVHTEVIDPAVEATCTSTGLTEGKHCSECGEVIIAQQTVPVKHTIVTDEAVASTCTSTGLTEGQHCSICNTILVEQEIVELIDHKEGSWIIDKEAGKTESGFKHNECTMCGKVMVEETIDATGSIHLNYNTKYVTCILESRGGCEDTDVIVPDTYNGKPVGEIYIGAFKGDLFLDSIIIGNNVKTIGTSAFSDCGYLKTVILGSSVESIDMYAFKDCDSLVKVTMPVSVRKIDMSAFSSCGIFTIEYQGTMAQWNAIRKDDKWCLASTVTVYCTDGTLTY